MSSVRYTRGSQVSFRRGFTGKRLLLASVGMAALSTTPVWAENAPKERQGGSIGVGVTMGDVDGFSLKAWSGLEHAIQLRIGSASSLNSVGIRATYEKHFRPIEVADHVYSLPFYVGGGLRFQAASMGSTYLDSGLVGVIGMSVLVPDLPVEIFMEASPQVVLYNPAVGYTTGVDLGFQIEGQLGVHYYF